MLILKILGGIDIIAALLFLTIAFGINPFISLILFSSGLLFLKSLFIFSGDVLSGIDLLSSVLLFSSIFLTLPTILIWAPAFFLLAKGLVSFI